MTIDLTGQTFGELTVISKAGVDTHNRATWLCRCKCGGSRIAPTALLTGNKVLNCGNCRDYTGVTIESYNVIKRDGINGQGNQMWLCQHGDELVRRSSAQLEGLDRTKKRNKMPVNEMTQITAERYMAWAKRNGLEASDAMEMMATETGRTVRECFEALGGKNGVYTNC